MSNADAFKEFLLNMPALEPPPGVESNFDDPPNHLAFAYGILISSLVLTFVPLVIRFYVTIFLQKKLYAEDWVLLVASLLQVGHFAPAFHVSTYAPVLHQWDMRVRDIKKFLMDFHVGAILYDATILTLKLAIFLQFLRIFIPRGDRSFTFWTTHILLWVNTIFYTIVIFTEIFACQPMKKIWDPLVLEGKCLNTPMSYLICASFNFALDFLMLVWTQKVIWNLNMSTLKKLQVGVLFLAGIVACVFGGLGVWQNVELLRTEDETYAASFMALYTFPETTSGFLVLCLPVFPKCFSHFWKKLFPNHPSPLSSLRAKWFPRTRRSPRVYSDRANSSGKKRQRSLWHITTASSVSAMNIEIEPKDSNEPRQIESNRGSGEVEVAEAQPEVKGVERV